MHGWARRPLLRRLVTVPAVLVLAVVGVATLPLTLLVALLLDLGLGPRRSLRRVRVVLLVVGLVVIEAIGTLRSGVAWVRAGGGRGLAGAGSTARHHALERWWTGAHRGLLRHVGGMRLVVHGAEAVGTGPVVAIGRHTSHADAALPAWLLAIDHGFRLRYVLKQDLQWSPCMDIVGNRLPNHFVDRDPADPDAELAAVRSLAERLAPDEAVVIFPEGTFPTAARRRRAVERIRTQDPDRADRVQDLLVLLPPRPGGTLALLDGAPDADVLLIAHVGFERLSSIRELVRGLPFPDPVEVRVWRIPRADVPDGADARTRWLDDRWHELDAWVATRLLPGDPPQAPDPSPAATPTTGGPR